MRTNRRCKVFSLRINQDESSVLDPVIEEVISEMKGFEANQEEYTQMAYNLKVLMEAKAAEPRKEKVSPNTVAVIIGGIVQIAMIVIFERTGVLTSKSLPFVLKPRT
jgi:hypothetical protein